MHIFLQLLPATVAVTTGIDATSYPATTFVLIHFTASSAAPLVGDIRTEKCVIDAVTHDIVNPDLYYSFVYHKNRIVNIL